MNCPKCSVEVDNTALFCTNCGCSIPVGLRCPQCATALLPGDQFCSGCGCAISSLNETTLQPCASQEAFAYGNQALLHAIIGNNADYYLTEFKKIEAEQKSLNWLTFFFSPILLLYRKMYKEFMRFILPFQISLIVLMILTGCVFTGRFGLGAIGAGATLAVIGIALPILVLVYLIRLLIHFNVMYMRQILGIASEMQRLPQHEAQALAARKGQTGIKWIIVYFSAFAIVWMAGFLFVADVAERFNDWEAGWADVPQQSISLEAVGGSSSSQPQADSYTLEISKSKIHRTSEDDIVLVFFNFTNNSDTECSFDTSLMHEA